MKLLPSLLGLLLAATAAADDVVVPPVHIRNLLLPPPLPGWQPADNGTVQRRAAATVGTAFFQQLLDHSHPELGTFKQQFWWDSSTWAGPGSPVCRPSAPRREAGGLTGRRWCSSRRGWSPPPATPDT
jgi:hypothetical protein